MYRRTIIIWAALLVLAFANGAMRVLVIIPALGDYAGHIISSVLLSLLIFSLSYLSIRWLAPTSRKDTIMIGAVWLCMTVAFEFLAGHYLFGNPWEKLLADYNIVEGRIWVAVLFTTMFAPFVTANIRRLV